MNPYIAGSLEQQQAGGAPLWMPREPCSSAAQGPVGVSAFAFQGTNAHVVLAARPAAHLQQPQCGVGAAASAAAWARRRHWYAPAPHRLLLACSTSSGARGSSSTSTFHCRLQRAHHAYLWEHAVSGRSLLAGAAMFECAFAAVAILLAEEQQQLQPGLAGAAVSAPLLLPPLGGKDGREASTASLLLMATVQQRSSTVELSSSSGDRAKPQLHLRASDHALIASSALQSSSEPSPQAVLPALLPAAGAAAVWLGEAVGVVHLQPLLRGVDGYHCHPAATDAATHFGAVRDLAGGAPPKVPVALGCYRAHAAPGSGGSPSQQQLHAFAAAGWLHPDGSRTSSFGLEHEVASATSTAVRLAGLQSRALRARLPAAARTAAPATAVPDELAGSCCAYQTVWQAVQRLPTPALGTPAGAGRTALRLRSPAGAVAVQPQCQLQQQALCAFAAAARLAQGLQQGQLQQLAARAPGMPGAALPAGLAVCRGAVAGGIAAGAVAGLFKVAALEEPSWRLCMEHADPLAAGLALTPLAGADAHGAAATGGLAYLPRLLLCQQQPARGAASAASLHLDPVCSTGCHIITGGMGGLGLLAAAALAERGQPLLLLGRTAHLAHSAEQQQLPAHLLRSSTAQVTLLQCNISAVGDAAAVAHQLLGDRPAASFLHTAGVLADALLTKQRLADARRVFAPKLAGLAAAMPHLQRQPLRCVFLACD